MRVRGPVNRVFDGDHELVALPGTPVGNVSGPVVDVGPGLRKTFRAANLDGKVAMASTQAPDGDNRWIHRMEKYAAAVENGAVSFLFQNHLPGGLPPGTSVAATARNRSPGSA